MNVVFKAITDKFLEAPVSDLYTSIGGRFYFYNAPPGAPLPYVIYEDISNDTEFNFTSTFDNYRIQFSIFSSSANQGAAQILNIYDYLKAVFDDCQLTVTGYQFLNCERQFSNLRKDSDQDIWQYVVDYEVVVRIDS